MQRRQIRIGHVNAPYRPYYADKFGDWLDNLAGYRERAIMNADGARVQNYDADGERLPDGVYNVVVPNGDRFQVHSIRKQITG